MDPDYWNVKQV